MIINHNIAAMNAYRQLSLNESAQNSSMAKLSSGLRINSAADDAAGLSISEKMKGQINGLEQATRNAQDGNSMIQTADGALSTTTNILQRMRELATQASSDTNTTQDRQSIQDEMNQLTDQINNIGNTTEFNTQKLLNGGTTGPVTNVDAATAFTGAAVTGASGLTGDSHTIAVTYNAAANATDATISATQVGASGDTLAFDFGSANAAAANGVKVVVTSANAGTNVGASYDSTSNTITVTMSSTAATNTDTNVASAINGLATSNGIDFSKVTVTGSGAWDHTQSTPGEAATNVTSNVTTTAAAGGADAKLAGYTATIDGSAVTGTVSSAAGSRTYTTADGKSITANLGTFSFPTAGTTNNITFDQNNGFSAQFQIGANSGQTMTVNIDDMRAQALKISSESGGGTVTASNGQVASFVSTANVNNGTDNNNTEYSLDLSTADKASAAISVIDDAINAVSAQRSNLGAYENRLTDTINNLNTSDQNITSAESNITDVDMASEMMNQTKSSTLAQAAQAMLAQANQRPQQVLQLLR